MRIRSPSLKLLYVVVYGALQLAVTSVYGIVTLVPLETGQVVAPLLLLATVAIGVRSFRGAGEDVAAPRAWWRMSARPRAGFILGGAFVLGCAVDGFNAGHGTEAVLPASLQLISAVLLATLYLHSSIQLVRAGRRALAAAADLTPIPTLTIDATGAVEPEPDPDEPDPDEPDPDGPGQAVQATRPLTIIGITLAGTLLVVVLGSAAGIATVGIEPITSSILDGLTSGDYKAVGPSSPVYSSPTYGFRIRFPGTASVHAYSDGGIDVSYRNGTSDYSIVATTLDEAIPATKTHAFYLSVVKDITDENTTRVSLFASTIDGVESEQASFTSAEGLNPWNYAIVTCGTHLYQLNTYGVKAADTRKYLDSLVLVDRATGACR